MSINYDSGDIKIEKTGRGFVYSRNSPQLKVICKCGLVKNPSLKKGTWEVIYSCPRCEA